MPPTPAGSMAPLARSATMGPTARLILLLAAALLAACSASPSRPVDAPADSERLRTLLIEAADCESLFTIVGGLKPMSSGFWRSEISVDAPDLAALEATRQALAPLRSELHYADVATFAAVRDGRRHLEAYVVHRPSLAAAIARDASFWGGYGITPSTHPAEVVALVERMPRSDRWRGYGLLFGYPRPAVEFFVEAGERALAEGTEVGPGRDRRFLSIPTFAAAEGAFTYAVPIDHVETPADERLREQAAAILADYAAARAAIIAAPDPLPLLLDLDRRHRRHRGSPRRGGRCRDALRMSRRADPICNRFPALDRGRSRPFRGCDRRDGSSTSRRSRHLAPSRRTSTATASLR